MAAHSAAMDILDISQGLAAYIPFVIFLIAMGALTGFFSGLLGIGGGLILVPGLFFGLQALGYDSPHLMHIAIGTSLAAILPTGMSSARAHWKRGAVRLDIFRRMAPGTLGGSMLGVMTADHIGGQGLQFVFGFAVLIVAGLMFIDPGKYQLMKDVPGRAGLFFVGAFVGFMAALMGIGGALLCVPFMTLARVPMHAAVGTSSAIGLTISLPGAIGFLLIGAAQHTGIPFTLGYVNLAAWALIIPFSVMVAPLGAHVAHSLDVNRLRKVFAVFMVVISIKMLSGAFGG